MNLYLLRRENVVDYNEMYGAVVCAKDSKMARRIAASAESGANNEDYLNSKITTIRKIGEARDKQPYLVLAAILNG